MIVNEFQDSKVLTSSPRRHSHKKFSRWVYKQIYAWPESAFGAH